MDFLIEGHDDAGSAAYLTVSALRIAELGSDVTGWLRAGAVVPAGWVAVPGAPDVAPAPADSTRASAPQLGTSAAGTDDLEATDTTSATALDLGELTGIPLQLIAEPTSVADDEDQTGDTSTLIPRSKLPAVSMATSAPWNCTEHEGNRYRAQTTIATGYPRDGDASSLTYSATMKTTSGSAIWGGSAWRSGTETTTGGWGADFLSDSRKRSYRTVVAYGWYSCYNAAGYYTDWVFPIKQPGAAYYYLLSSRPNWTRCAQVSNNVTWRRTQSNANDYELSYGVKAKDWIGIEMYSRHGYSTSGELRYHISHGAKHVCGNNDTPGQAGKIQEKA